MTSLIHIVVIVSILISTLTPFSLIKTNNQQDRNPPTQVVGPGSRSTPTVTPTDLPPSPTYTPTTTSHPENAYPPPGATATEPAGTPTPDPEPDPTTTPTAPTPEPPDIPLEINNLEILVSAEPAIYLPGFPIQLHVIVPGFYKSSTTSNTQIIIQAPEGVAPSDKEIASAFSPERKLIITPDREETPLS